MREDTNPVYDARRCRVCGRPWNDGTERHPLDTECARYWPPEIPKWVGLAATKIDEAAIARRELVGGVATTEFDPTNPGGQGE